MTDQALFAAAPGVALIALGSVSVLRYVLLRQHGPLPSSSLARARRLLWDPWPWRVGLVGLLAVHLALLLLAQRVLAWNQVHWKLLLLEATTAGFGLFALAGLLAVLLRRLRSSQSSREGDLSAADTALLGVLLVAIVSGFIMASRYRWASSWSTVTLVPYVQSLFTGDVRLRLLAGMPYPVKLHVFSGIVLLGLLPFTSVVEVLLLPVDRVLTFTLRPVPRLARRAWVLLGDLGRRGATALSLNREED